MTNTPGNGLPTRDRAATNDGVAGAGGGSEGGAGGYASLHRILERILHISIIVSTAVLVGGGVFFLIEHGGERADFSQFATGPAALREPASIIRAAFQGNAAAIVQLGLLLVLATPLVREAASTVWFARHRNPRYTVIGLFVVGLLLFSIIGRQ